MNLVDIVLSWILAMLVFSGLAWMMVVNTGEIVRRLTSLEHQLKGINMTQAEALAQVREVKALLTKIGTETSATLQKVIDLQAIIDAGNGGNVSEELAMAIAELKVQAQSTDDLIPDAPTT